jgi:hypothetical protein
LKKIICLDYLDLEEEEERFLKRLRAPLKSDLKISWQPWKKKESSEF